MTFLAPGRKLTKSETIGYASGNFAKSLQWNTIGYLLLFYFTDIVGLSPSFAGLIILISLLWDGITDPPIAYLTDRYRHKFSSYQQLLLIGAPICAASFILMFYLPDITRGAQITYVILAALFFRTCYSLIDIPHNALLSNLTQDSRERTTLSAYRFFFSASASLALAFSINPLMANLKTGNGRNFFILALILSGVYILNILYCALSTWNIPRLHRRRQGPPRDVKTALKMLASNKPLIVILAMVACTGILLPTFIKLAVFYAKVNLNGAINSSTLLIGLAIGQILSMPIWSKVARKTEKKNTAYIAFIGIILTCTLFIAFPTQEIMVATLYFFLFGFFSGGVTMLNWALIPDTIEYGEKKFGARNEALTFGIFLFVVKAADGLNMGLIGLSLDIIGYTPDMMSPSLIASKLNLIMCLMPLLGAVLGIVIISFYSLTHEAHSKLVKQTET